MKQSIAASIEIPRMVRLDGNLYAACFTLMKMLPARFILDRARSEGRLQPGSILIETTSGTFGLALAMLSALRGYRLILVSDPAIDLPLQRRLEDLGARVEIVRQPAERGGYQQARLDRMAQLQSEHPDHFCPSQYDNAHNAGGYARFAEHLNEALGRVDCLVGTVGSGGSMSGTSSFLRLLFPEMQVVGVDTHRSVLFGQPDGKRLLRGLGNSLMPGNLDHTVFDEVHWVSAGQGFHATRQLHRRHAVYAGPTSGAAYMVADWWSRTHPCQTTVAILPDQGYRYQETVYNDLWLGEQGLLLEELPRQPASVEHPSQCAQGWTRLPWKRRSYQEVMGHPYLPEAAA